MKRFATICFVLLAGLSARAQTNLPSAASLLPDEKTVFDLTAGLTQYQNPPAFSGKLSSLGGEATTILVNRWATEFTKLYPEIQFDIHSGGSMNGMPALVSGAADIVPMSRMLTADEIARFKKKFGYEPAQILVAQDAIGFYVNKNNPVPGLTLGQLDAIYSRDAKRGGGRPEFWSELGVVGRLADQRINRICLSRVHGSRVYFQELVMRGAEYRFDVHLEVVPGSLVQAVGADDAAIGFTSVMFATERTRFVPVQAADGRYLLPSYENTVNGQYPIVRPMRIVFNRKPDGTMNPAAREFLRFAVSRRGQRIIALAGSYPLTAEQQTEAMREIGEARKK
jgi:phosphate transport system substrate-binding protein